MPEPIQLKLRSRNVVPPGGYRFYCRQTNKWSRTEHNSIQSCLREAREFYHQNNWPIPDDMARQIEQDLCVMLGSDWCEGCDPQNPIFYGKGLTLDTLKQGSATLAHHIARRIQQGQRVVVGADEVQRRAKICATGDPQFGRCRYNAGPTNCPSCGGKEVLQNLLGRVSQFLADCPPTPFDGQLAACTICQCPLRSKVCVPADIIRDHMPRSQQDQLPAWCWLKEG